MIDAHLRTLELSDLIRVAQVEPELEYLFRHALVQDAAYESLLKADRRRLHRLVGETMERLYPERLKELASLLAHHFDEAGEGERARPYFVLAAEHARAAYANPEAERHYRAALALTSDTAERAKLLWGLGRAVVGQSHYAQGVQIWREAIALYRSLADAPDALDNVALLYDLVSWYLWNSGETPGALEACEEGLAALAGAPETGAVAALLHEAARTNFFNGRTERAAELCARALAIAERLGDVRVEASSLITMALMPQRVESKVALLRRAIALLEPTTHKGIAARAHFNLGDLQGYSLGHFQEGYDHFLRAYELVTEIGADALGRLLCLNNTLEMLLWRGDLAGVARALPRHHRLLTESDNPGEAAFSLRVMEALFLRYQGEVEVAVAHLRDYRAMMKERGNLQNLARTATYLGEALVELGEWQEAVEVLQEPIAAAQRGLGGLARPAGLLCMAWAAQGQWAAAREALALARTDPAHGPQSQSMVSRAAAHLAAAEGNWEAALADFEATVAIQETLGQRWYQAQTLQGWAAAHVARGGAEARARGTALLARSLALYEGMGASRYAGQVQARLDALRSVG